MNYIKEAFVVTRDVCSAKMTDLGCMPSGYATVEWNIFTIVLIIAFIFSIVINIYLWREAKCLKQK